MRTTFIITLVAIVLSASAQDYQDYESSGVRRSLPSHGAQSQQVARPTPVPILKQINRHNEDGSYTYGYEGADGSYKIETKLANGEVKGKYGYVDANGELKTVEYGANKYGFQPSGQGITVPPPTLVDETTRKDGSVNPEYDDGQYYQPEPVTARPVQQVHRARPQQAPQPQYQPQQYQDFSIPQESPVPQRALVGGGSPSGIVYAEQPRPSPAPRPKQVFQPASFSFEQPQFHQPSQPQFHRQAAPQPQFHQQPAQQPQRYVAPAARGFTAPTPPRFAPQIPGAVPAPEGRRLEPAPVQQHLDEEVYSRPQPRFVARPPQGQPIQFSPAPQQARPAPQGRQIGGVLDQLAKDYALPENSAAALHDISFGFY